MKFKDLIEIKGMTDSDLRYLGILKVKGWKKINSDLDITEEQVIHLTRNLVENTRLDKHKRTKLRELGIQLASDNPQLVYFMVTSNRIKIGISKNPNLRMKELSTGSGDVIHLVAVWKTMDDAAYVENHLHKTFKQYRVNGEWFTRDVTVDMIEDAIPCLYERTHTFNKPCADLGVDCGKTKLLCYKRIKHETENAILFDYFDNDVWIAKSLITHNDMVNNLVTVKSVTKIPKIF